MLLWLAGRRLFRASFATLPSRWERYTTLIKRMAHDIQLLDLKHHNTINNLPWLCEVLVKTF